MRIAAFHVDGFGVFHDQGVESLPPGLLLFAGANEAGKTTLLAFFRTVLFGPPRSRSRNPYPPLAGGAHGGRVRLVTAAGEGFTVERRGRSATVTADGASPRQAEPSKALLGGLDRATFEGVFALGLEDLQGIGVLAAEPLRSRILAAGAGLAPGALPRALERLDKERAGLLGGPRSKRRINELLATRRELDAAVDRARDEAGAHAALSAGRLRLAGELAGLGESVTELDARLAHLDRLRRAAGPWAALTAARAALEKGAAAEAFPEDGPGRLERLDRRLADLHRLSEERAAGGHETAAELSRQREAATTLPGLPRPPAWWAVLAPALLGAGLAALLAARSLPAWPAAAVAGLLLAGLVLLLRRRRLARCRAVRESLLQEIERLTRSRALETAESERLVAQTTDLTAERRALLTEAGAATPRDFLERAEAHREHRRAARDAAVREAALAAIAGSAEELRRLTGELAAGAGEDAESRLRQAEARRRALDARSREILGELGRLDERLAGLAARDRLGELHQQRAFVQGELQALLRRWTRAALCRHLLDRARAVYEAERQPRVVREAGALLRSMTGGRHRLTLSPEGELAVEEEDLRRRPEGTWSSGLADQVYLALRLGLAREFGRHREPLPLLLDDVHLRFDPRRRQGLIRVLLEVSRDQQVLFFTSHPEVVELFRRQARSLEPPVPDPAVLSLAAGRIDPA